MQIKLIKKGEKMRISSIPSYRVYSQNKIQKNPQQKQINFGYGDYGDEDQANRADMINEQRAFNQRINEGRKWYDIWHSDDDDKPFKEKYKNPMDENDIIDLIEDEYDDDK